VQSIVDKSQGTVPKESDIFSLTDNTYNDVLDKEIVNLSDKQEQEIYADPKEIKNIDNPSERLQLIAVKQDGFAIQYIDNPTEKVQLAAVKEDSGVIQYIDNPSEKVQLEAVR
jgi:rRNA processing protein Gar1